MCPSKALSHGGRGQGREGSTPDRWGAVQGGRGHEGSRRARNKGETGQRTPQGWAVGRSPGPLWWVRERPPLNQAPGGPGAVAGSVTAGPGGTLPWDWGQAWSKTRAWLGREGLTWGGTGAGPGCAPPFTWPPGAVQRGDCAVRTGALGRGHPQPRGSHRHGAGRGLRGPARRPGSSAGEGSVRRAGPPSSGS